MESRDGSEETLDERRGKEISFDEMKGGGNLTKEWTDVRQLVKCI